MMTITPMQKKKREGIMQSRPEDSAAVKCRSQVQLQMRKSGKYMTRIQKKVQQRQKKIQKKQKSKLYAAEVNLS